MKSTATARVEDSSHFAERADGLSRTERDSLQLETTPDPNVRPAELAGNRMVFNRLTLTALENGSGRRDVATDEFEEFFQPENDLVRGRKAICEYFDNLEVSALSKDWNRDLLTRAPSKSKKMSWGERIKSGLKGLGKMALSAADALLPNSVQTFPKLNQIEGLKNQRQEDLDKAEKACTDDLRAIERGYDVVKAYVADFYSDLINPFDYTNAGQLQEFYDQCFNQPESLHFKNVQRIIELRKQARLAQWEEEKKRILADNSAEETITEIRKSSWLLNVIDSLRAKSSKPAEGSVGTPSANRRTDDKNNAGGDNGDSGGRSKWPYMLGGAAALFTGAMLVKGAINDKPQTSNETAAETTESADDTSTATATVSTPESLPGGISEQTDNLPPETAPAEAVPAKEPPASESKPASKAAALPAFSKQRPWRQTAGLKTRPTVAQPKSGPVTLIPEAKKTEETPKATESQPEKPEQTAEQKMEEARRQLTARLSAYRQRVRAAQTEIAGFPAKSPYGVAINRDLKTVTTTLEEIAPETKDQAVMSEPEVVNDKLARVDRTMKSVDKHIAAINIADAHMASLSAKDRLTIANKLAAKHGPRFTIVHNDKQKGIVAYNVDLEHIQKRLSEIHAQATNSKDLTFEQARMLRMDAQYWVNYLKFTNWYLQYSPEKVTKSS